MYLATCHNYNGSIYHTIWYVNWILTPLKTQNSYRYIHMWVISITQVYKFQKNCFWSECHIKFFCKISRWFRKWSFFLMEVLLRCPRFILFLEGKRINLRKTKKSSFWWKKPIDKWKSFFLLFPLWTTFLFAVFCEEIPYLHKYDKIKNCF